MNNFQQQLLNSQSEELRIVLKHELYPQVFPSLYAVEYDENLSFQNTGCDLKIYVEKPKGNRMTITCEEKIRTAGYWDTKDLLLETHSNQEYNTAGWCFTSQADYLIYIWDKLPELRVFMCPMVPLTKWFQLHYHRYESKGAKNKQYTTMNRVVPIDDKYFRAFRMSNGYRILLRHKQDDWQDITLEQKVT